MSAPVDPPSPHPKTSDSIALITGAACAAR